MAASNSTLNTTLGIYPSIPWLQDIPPVLQNFTWVDCDPRIDCELAARCLNEELQNDHLAASTSSVLVDFARTCAPEPLTNISFEQILSWNSHVVLTQGISVIDLLDEVNRNCHLEFCQNLDWEGDPDLAGPGVMAAYIIQAILASGFLSFYLFVKVAEWMTQRRHITLFHNQPHAILQSLLPGVNRCFEVFWISATYFGLAISFATYIIDAIAKTGPGGSPTLSRYVASFSFLGTVFCWATTMSLAPWFVRGGGAPPGGTLLLFIFHIITSSAIILSAGSNLQGIPRWIFHFNVSHFEIYCLAHLGVYGDLKVFIIIPLCCVVFTYILVFIFLAFVATNKIGNLSTRCLQFMVRQLRRMRGATSFGFFLIMWVSLGLFLRLRSEASGISNRRKDGDTQWGFGQVVAVVGWLPMAFEIIYALIGQAWRNTAIIPHVEAATADVDTHKLVLDGQSRVKLKKVKTW